MNLLVHLVLQSVALPLILSVAGLAVVRRRDLDPAILLAAWWLIYFWMVGLPDWPPLKALDWVGLLATLSVAMSWWISAGRRLLWGQMLLFAATPLLLGWPLIVQQPTASLVIELAEMAVIGALTVVVIIKGPTQHRGPAFLTSSMGLAVAAALAGSLLIGELAAVLASCLGGWILYDSVRRRKISHDVSSAWHMVPLAFLFLALLVSARLYADLPLTALGCLQIAPLIALLSTWRHSWVFSLFPTGVAIAFLVWMRGFSAYPAGY